MSEKCATSWVGGCCCNCRWHKPAAKSGSLSATGGWVCWAPEFDVAIIESPKHGFCEGWKASSQEAQVLMDLRRELYDPEMDGVLLENGGRWDSAVVEARSRGVLLP